MKRDDIYGDDFDMNEKSTEKAAPAQEPKTVKKEAAPQGTLQMKLIRPKKLSEATEIADCLKEGQTVVLNLDEMADTAARRILDYIAGVIYIINGTMERPADRTFLLTPAGVRIAKDESEDKE